MLFKLLSEIEHRHSEIHRLRCKKITKKKTDRTVTSKIVIPDIYQKQCFSCYVGVLNNRRYLWVVSNKQVYFRVGHNIIDKPTQSEERFGSKYKTGEDLLRAG